MIENRGLIFNDIINLSKYIINNNAYKNNYYIIWKNKIKILNKYYNDCYCFDNYDFNYFYELSNIALKMIKNINFNNLTYGLSFNRFYKVNLLYDLYNKNNYKIGPIVNSITEYIKYSFFYNDREENIFLIDNLDLSREDYIYLVSRLIFPTYYFDILNNNDIDDKHNMIMFKINKYFNYIKSIIMEIKKRHIDMPFIDSIINLF